MIPRKTFVVIMVTIGVFGGHQLNHLLVGDYQQLRTETAIGLLITFAALISLIPSLKLSYVSRGIRRIMSLAIFELSAFFVAGEGIDTGLTIGLPRILSYAYGNPVPRLSLALTDSLEFFVSIPLIYYALKRLLLTKSK